MGKVRPTALLTNFGKNVPKTDTQYVTQCKVCGCGVYRGQRYSWRRDPLGISHDDCTVGTP